ncbi:biotin-dependent carboxyltransferase family protein [Paenibacillus allorhizosphaerae]|uniref:5-oxoprolinase subunit C n=1 Tax=Paenibacillus allorhizosphaerae TaxID=2849866 RepID=A0ABM8VSD4_9BACL|nr:biotin-dependent carboxyltransferase family protein [Paenibacillus allorhizosphaerae]CAG7656477.1 5-oxoprolinase subunit C [Paenibacillus allorhizosphaerae]
MGIVVESPGLLTTVQDGGRFGSRAIGVSVGGAADTFALRTANALVGNAPGAAALETTMTGASLRFERDALVALCGADHPDARAEDGTPLPGWLPVFVRSGTLLRLGPARRGLRAMLAVAGGIAVPAVLGSRSTHMRAALGGFAGRALQAGDRLPAGPLPAAAAALAARLARTAAPGTALVPSTWGLAPRWRPPYAEQPTLRVMRGREADSFEAASLEALFAAPYRVTPQSDRMGCRLEGGPLRLRAPLEMISEAVAPGAVQVPPDGQPIALLAEAQTTGGYPRIAHIAAVDLPLLAQVRPGGAVRFAEIGLEEAQALYVMRERALRQFTAAAAVRIKSL